MFRIVPAFGLFKVFFLNVIYPSFVFRRFDPPRFADVFIRGSVSLINFRFAGDVVVKEDVVIEFLVNA